MIKYKKIVETYVDGYATRKYTDFPWCRVNSIVLFFVNDEGIIIQKRVKGSRKALVDLSRFRIARSNEF